MNKLTKLAGAIALVTTNVVSANTITGVIQNQQGKGLSNAVVEIAGTNIKVRTDNKGRFRIEQVRVGEVEIHVEAEKHLHLDKKVQVPSTGLESLVMTLNPSAFEVLEVKGGPIHLSSVESAMPVNVVAGDELKLKQASTLGETLKGEMGIQGSYFGPVSSSPIIRGLDGPRVMIAQNGLDSGDVSRIGPDHAISSEASSATRIEVLRGPATLFYGSGAIGGVVNVVDDRVPTDTETRIDWMVERDSGANEKLASASLSTGQDNVAFHVDGFWRDSDSYKIPGFAESDSLYHEDEDEHGDEGDHDEHAHDRTFGHLPNSQSESYGANLGLSYIVDNGHVGFSYGELNRLYGLTGHSHGDEVVQADMHQKKFLMSSELNLEHRFFEQASTRVGFTKYIHQELEGDEIGTVFTSETHEAKIDLTHRPFSGWYGGLSVHGKRNQYTAEGEEAFTPPSVTSSFALSLVEEKHLGDDWVIQFGLRAEHVDISASGLNKSFGHDDVHDEHDEHDEHDDDHEDHADEDYGANVNALSQSYTPLSFSSGVTWEFSKGYNLGFSYSRTQRAPSTGELLALGPHLGAGTFEVGALYDIHNDSDELEFELEDGNIDLETANNIELSFKKFSGDLGIVINGFWNNVDNYYYQQDSGFHMEAGHEDHGDEGDIHEGDGHEDEGLPVFGYQVRDAELYGLEAQVVWQINQDWRFTATGDLVKARLTDGTQLPRTPPARLGGVVHYEGPILSGELSVMHHFNQDDIAQHETTTPGYTLIDGNINFYYQVGDIDLTFYVKGKNLLNEEARVHSSFLKNLAPIPGRSISLGVRGQF